MGPKPKVLQVPQVPTEGVYVHLNLHEIKAKVPPCKYQIEKPS
jgi:hypothetical protein